MYEGSVLRLFFIFQAEDGIRDIGVTGVQTCALPISFLEHEGQPPRSSRQFGPAGQQVVNAGLAEIDLHLRAGLRALAQGRSEERRVGKECRSRWSPYH